jgi:hypothetical protein
MQDTRALALLAREAFRSAFRLGDVIPFARRKGFFTIVEFTDRGIRVRSTQRAEGYLLDFEKLGVVVKDFGSIPVESAHDGVGDLLRRHGLAETSTETVLYAAAKEFLGRSGLPRSSRGSQDADLITEAMNRLSEELDTKPDRFLSAVSSKTLAGVEW